MRGRLGVWTLWYPDSAPAIPKDIHSRLPAHKAGIPLEFLPS